jgi:sugar phosphate permease
MVQLHAPATLRRRHYLIITLFVVVGLVNSLDRATLSIANPLIRHDLGLSAGQMGLLLSAFLWAYAWTQLPLGMVMDRVVPRRMVGWAVICWSAVQGLAGFAGGFGQLFALRLALGVGEAPQVPTFAKIIRSWFGPRDRGLPTAMFTGSFQIATAIAAPLLTWLMLSFGWRVMFMIMGVAGIVSGSLWFMFYHDPAAVPLSDEEQNYLHDGKPAAAQTLMTFSRWSRLLTMRTTWGVLLGFVGYNYLDSIYRYWLPGYLEIEHHLSIALTGLVATIPLTSAIFGSLCGGLFADLLARRGYSPMMSGRIPCIVGTITLALATIALVNVGTLPAAVVCLSFATWGGHMSGSSAWVLVTAAAPQDSIGSLGGMQNWVGSSAGATSAIVTGYIVQATGSFFFALMTGLAVAIGAALVYIFVPTKPIDSSQLDAPGTKLATPV